MPACLDRELPAAACMPRTQIRPKEAQRLSEAQHGVEQDVPPVDDVEAEMAAVGETDVPAAAEGPVVAIVARRAQVKHRQQPDLLAGLAALLQSRQHGVTVPVFAHGNWVAVLALGNALWHLHPRHNSHALCALPTMVSALLPPHCLAIQCFA